MTGTRQQLKKETHARVIEAATALFTERGFETTTVRDIAALAAVSPGTVISVGDKNALLIKVYDNLIADQHAQRSRAADTGVSGTCVDRLETLVAPFVSMFMDNPSLSRSYASVLVSGTQNSALFTKLADKLITEFATAISAHRCTSPTEAQAKSRALYFAYVGTLFTWSAQASADASALQSNLRSTFASICNCKE